MKKMTLGVLTLAMLLSFAKADAATYNFNSNLTLGASGTEVTQLQQFLVAKGYMVMPSGVSYGYFGNLTKQSLIKYQAAKGIFPQSGYFGPLTRASVNATTDTTGPAGPTTGGDVLQGADGDFKDFKVLGSPSSENIEKGDGEKVLGFEFKADDSDLRIDRLDVQVTGNGNTAKPWKYIDSLVLYNGDKKIATVDAGSKSDWDEQSKNEFEITFNKINEVVKDGKTARFYVEVVAKDSIKDSDLPLSFNIFLSNDGLRAVNAEKVNVYEGSKSQSKTFTLRQASEGQLLINVDSSDNKDRVVGVNKNTETDDVVLYTSSIESTDGDNTIESVTVSLATTSGTTARLSDMIQTLYLYIDGDEVGSVSVNGAGTDSVTFDNVDYDLGEDDEVSLEIRADIDRQDGNYENGAGVQVKDISIDYVDGQDDDHTESDSTEGGEVSFSTDAIIVEVGNQTVPSYIGNDESKGRYVVKFNVTAPVKENLYIDLDSAADIFKIVNASTGDEATVTSSEAVLSGGSVSNGKIKISKNQTKTLTLTVILDNDGGDARSLQVGLSKIMYRVGSVGATEMEFTSGLDEDFQTDSLYLYGSNIL